MAKLDLDVLEQLLETMEPSEIRARYKRELASLPECGALLDHFESMDGYLSELKASVGPPPAIRLPKNNRWTRIMPWALPLAAALVFGVLIITRTSPQPVMNKKELVSDQSPLLRIAPADSAKRDESVLAVAEEAMRDDEDPAVDVASNEGLKKKARKSPAKEESAVELTQDASADDGFEKKASEKDEAFTPVFATDPEPEKPQLAKSAGIKKVKPRVVAPASEPNATSPDYGEQDKPELRERGRVVALDDLAGVSSEREGRVREKQAVVNEVERAPSRSDSTSIMRLRSNSGTGRTDSPAASSDSDFAEVTRLARVEERLNRLANAWNTGAPFPNEIFAEDARIRWSMLSEQVLDTVAAAESWAAWTGRKDRPEIRFGEPSSDNDSVLVEWRAQGALTLRTGAFHMELDARGLILRIGQ